MKAKLKAQTQQQKNGELRLIIEEFSRAMWSANREYIAQPKQCQHDPWIRFTPGMERAWAKYFLFCVENPE